MRAGERNEKLERTYGTFVGIGVAGAAFVLGRAAGYVLHVDAPTKAVASAVEEIRQAVLAPTIRDIAKRVYEEAGRQPKTDPEAQ